MVFSDIFWWGFRFFRLSCTSKTWNKRDLSSLMSDFQKRPYREQTFHDWWFSPTYLGSKHPFFFQLQGNLNQRMAFVNISAHWGAILESILKTRFRTAETFLRPTAMGRGSKIGMGRGKGGAMGKGKGAGNPEAKPHGWKTAEIRWAFKRSSLHATVGVSTVVVASWLPRPVGVRNVLTLSTFCFQFICLRMPPLSSGIVSVKMSLFVLLLHFLEFVFLFWLSVSILNWRTVYCLEDHPI